VGFWYKRKRFPENVVPPVVRLPRPLVGVSYFCGWETRRAEYGIVPRTECPDEYPWTTLKTPDRKMAIGGGQYDEADPRVTKQRIEWAEWAGIDFFTYQVQWAHAMAHPSLLPAWRPPIDPLLMKHCADNHPSTSRVKWCFSNWDVMALSTDPYYWLELKSQGWTADHLLDSWRQYARRVASYMRRESYLWMNGQPVLMMGGVEGLERYKMFGVDPLAIVDVIRSEVVAATGKLPYLVAQNTAPEYRSELQYLFFHALAEYLLHGDGWDDTMKVYDYWYERDVRECSKWGLNFWVPVTAGYDSKAWGSPVALSHMPTPRQFEDHLKKAMALAGDAGVVLIYAGNEIGEGGIIEPMMPGQLHNGNEMLAAIRKVLSSTARRG
jgi:hypothetical protein